MNLKWYTRNPAQPRDGVVQTLFGYDDQQRMRARIDQYAAAAVPFGAVALAEATPDTLMHEVFTLAGDDSVSMRLAGVTIGLDAAMLLADELCP